MTVLVARPVCPIGGGSAVEVQVSVPDVMVSWSVVGVDNMDQETVANGELASSYGRTNIDGKAFNYYFAPVDMPPTGYRDRVRATIYG